MEKITFREWCEKNKISESWSEKYKRSINCDNPKGFSQRAHCAGKKKRIKEYVDLSLDDLDTPNIKYFNNTKHIESDRRYCPTCKKSELRSECRYGPRYWDMFSLPEKLKEHCGCEPDAVKDLETGLKKLKDISYDSIDKLMRRIMKEYDMTAKQLHNAFVSEHDKTPDEWIKELKEGTLHHWFKGSRSKDGKPGWVQADGSPCANEPGEKGTPKCFSSARLSSLKSKGETGEKIIRSAVRRKKQQDPNQQSKSGGAKPTMVKTFAKGKEDKNYVKAEPSLKEGKDIKGKGSGTKDACYKKVKARYDVWPSAYASGALVKCRKVGAANWGNKSKVDEACWSGYKQVGLKKKGKKMVPNCVPVKEEHNNQNEMRFCPLCNKNETRIECVYGPKFWDQYAVKNLTQVVTDRKSQLMGMREEYKKIQTSGCTYTILFSWRSSSVKSIQMFFPYAKKPSRMEVKNELEKVYPGALLSTYYQSIVDPNQPLILTKS